MPEEIHVGGIRHRLQVRCELQIPSIIFRLGDPITGEELQLLIIILF